MTSPAMHDHKASSSTEGSSVFLYRKHRSVGDRITLSAQALCAFYFAKISIRGIQDGGGWAALVLVVAILVIIVRSLTAKAKLEVRELDFEHLTRTGMPETVRFDAVGEIIETSFNLLIVHQTKKGWMRLEFAKSDFCLKCWPRIVSLLKERTRTHSPSASIVDCAP
jgi:hypothetical protein